MARVKDIIEEHYESGKTSIPKQLIVRGINWGINNPSLNPQLDLPLKVVFDVSESEFEDLESIGVEDTVNSWLNDTFSVDFIDYKSVRFVY